MADAIKPHEWPERLKLRDTKVIADEGQRILTNATGYGYEQHTYVRADLHARLQEQLEAVTRECERWEQRACTGDDVLGRTRTKLEAAEARAAKAEAELNRIKKDDTSGS